MSSNMTAQGKGSAIQEGPCGLSRACSPSSSSMKLSAHLLQYITRLRVDGITNMRRRKSVQLNPSRTCTERPAMGSTTPQATWAITNLVGPKWYFWN